MRTKTIVEGFKNSQRFRFILTAGTGEEVGMVITIRQMSDNFATRSARTNVWIALNYLALNRRRAKDTGAPLPTGITMPGDGFHQVQVDLH